MTEDAEPSFLEAAERRLNQLWQSTLAGTCPPPEALTIPKNIQDAITRSIASKTKSYRYDLPTQLLAKRVNPKLDCRAVQKNSKLREPFDARSLCHKVIVPFERTNHRVLGGSPEPYVINTLRIPDITPRHRAAQRDKTGFDDLRSVLDYAQSDPEHVEILLRLVLCAIKERLQHVHITYPVPNRVSAKHCTTVLAEFLAPRTGGLRAQAVATALFRAIGQRFRILTTVKSKNINVADSQAGTTANLECLDDFGNVVLAVEVKDRQLTLRQTEDKLPAVREKGIRELIFLVQGGNAPSEHQAIDNLIEKEFTTGQNIYVSDFGTFMDSCLILLGEPGRRSFLQSVGDELDRLSVDLSHRQAWRDLLAQI